MIKVYCETMERADPRIQPGDILVALEEFEKDNHGPAERIFLNPRMIKKLGDSIPEGLEIIEHGGVASWEIRLDGPDGVINPPSPAPEPPPAKATRKNPRKSKKRGSKPPQHSYETPRNRLQSAAIAKKKKDVSKLMLHKSKGRPAKKGKVHRTTHWRRQKKMQGVLL